jgi:hypothetical protein
MELQKESIIQPTIIQFIIGYIMFVTIISLVIFVLIGLPLDLVYQKGIIGLLRNIIEGEILFLIIGILPIYNYNKLRFTELIVKGPTMWGLFWGEEIIPYDKIVNVAPAINISFLRFIFGEIIFSSDNKKIHIMWLGRNLHNKLIETINIKRNKLI